MDVLPGTESHPHARAVLSAALRPGGRPSHAYLFHGPAGVGKRTAARALAAALLAEGAPDPEGVRARVERGAHPDLAWITPSGAHEMLVGDVAEPVVAAASRTPFEARRRVFVLECADTLVPQAANRLLKTLEEPPEFAHLVLLTDRLVEVLPTIQSRCQHVRFDALTAGELAGRLSARGVPEPQATACARLSLGDGERALELALGEGVALRAAAETFARAPLASASADLGPILDLARKRGKAAIAAVDEQRDAELETASKKDRKRIENDYTERGRRVRRRVETAVLDTALGLSGQWYRDLACLAHGAPELVHHADRLDELSADAQGRDPLALRRAVELVEDTRRRLTFNVTEDLAGAALAHRLREALQAA